MSLRAAQAKKIFILEEDRDNSQALSELLSIYGYQTDCSADCLEAFDKLHIDGIPKLILLDLASIRAMGTSCWTCSKTTATETACQSS